MSIPRVNIVLGEIMTRRTSAEVALIREQKAAARKAKRIAKREAWAIKNQNRIAKRAERDRLEREREADQKARRLAKTLADMRKGATLYEVIPTERRRDPLPRVGLGYVQHCIYTDEGTVEVWRRKLSGFSAARPAVVRQTEKKGPGVRGPRGENPGSHAMILKPFQAVGVNWLVDHFRCLLGDDMGLGKTVQILSLVARCPGIERVLVVPPASLKINWAREAGLWAPGKSVQIVRGRAPVLLEADIVIINYEILSAHENQLSSVTWDLAVFDEAHYIKNAETKRGGVVFSRLIKTPRLIFATGSPMINRPVELWSILFAIDRALAGTFEDFTRRHCGGKFDKFGQWWAMGAHNLEELHRKIAPVMLRRTKAEVLPDLPPRIRTVVELDDLPASLEVLRSRVGQDFRSELKKPRGARAPSAVARFDEMLSRIRREDGLAKVPAVAAHVRMLLEAGEKVLLFGWHRDVVTGLAAILGCPRVIMGDTPTGVAQKHRDEFQARDDVRLIVGNIQSLGTGHTLTKTTAVVFAELSHSPLDMDQAESRGHRIGLDHPISIHYMVAAGSVDARMGPALIRKLENFDKVVNGVRSVDDFDVSEIFMSGV